jgi:hypothetical protein
MSTTGTPPRNIGRPGDGELREHFVRVLTHLAPGNRRT